MPALNLRLKERVMLPIETNDENSKTTKMEGVYETDRNGNIVYLNESRIAIDEDDDKTGNVGTYKFIAKTRMNRPKLLSDVMQKTNLTISVTTNAKGERFITGTNERPAPYYDGTIMYRVRTSDNILQDINKEPLTFYFNFMGKPISLKDAINVDFSDKGSLMATSLSAIADYAPVFRNNYLSKCMKDLDRRGILAFDDVSGIIQEIDDGDTADKLVHALGLKNSAEAIVSDKGDLNGKFVFSDGTPVEDAYFDSIISGMDSGAAKAEFVSGKFDFPVSSDGKKPTSVMFRDGESGKVILNLNTNDLNTTSKHSVALSSVNGENSLEAYVWQPKAFSVSEFLDFGNSLNVDVYFDKVKDSYKAYDIAYSYKLLLKEKESIAKISRFDFTLDTMGFRKRSNQTVAITSSLFVAPGVTNGRFDVIKGEGKGTNITGSKLADKKGDFSNGYSYVDVSGVFEPVLTGTAIMDATFNQKFGESEKERALNELFFSRLENEYLPTKEGTLSSKFYSQTKGATLDRDAVEDFSWLNSDDTIIVVSGLSASEDGGTSEVSGFMTSAYFSDKGNYIMLGVSADAINGDASLSQAEKDCLTGGLWADDEDLNGLLFRSSDLLSTLSETAFEKYFGCTKGEVIQLKASTRRHRRSGRLRLPQGRLRLQCAARGRRNRARVQPTAQQ